MFEKGTEGREQSEDNQEEDYNHSYSLSHSFSMSVCPDGRRSSNRKTDILLSGGRSARASRNQAEERREGRAGRHLEDLDYHK